MSQPSFEFFINSTRISCELSCEELADVKLKFV